MHGQARRDGRRGIDEENILEQHAAEYFALRQVADQDQDQHGPVDSRFLAVDARELDQVADMEEEYTDHDDQTDDAQFVEDVEVAVMRLQRNPVQGIDDHLRWAAFAQPESAVADAEHRMALHFQQHETPDVGAAGEVGALVEQGAEGGKQLVPFRQAAIEHVEEMQAEQ